MSVYTEDTLVQKTTAKYLEQELKRDYHIITDGNADLSCHCKNCGRKVAGRGTSLIHNPLINQRFWISAALPASIPRGRNDLFRFIQYLLKYFTKFPLAWA